MDNQPLDGGRRVMLGLVLTAVLLIAGGLGLMMWDDRSGASAAVSSITP